MWLADLLVSVFLYNLPTLATSATNLIDEPGSCAALAALSLVMCAVYLLHRRYPIAVLSSLLVLALIQMLFGAPVVNLSTSASSGC